MKFKWHLGTAAAYGAIFGPAFSFLQVLLFGGNVPNHAAGLIGFSIGAAAAGALLFAMGAFIHNLHCSRP